MPVSQELVGVCSACCLQFSGLELEAAGCCVGLGARADLGRMLLCCGCG